MICSIIHDSAKKVELTLEVNILLTSTFPGCVILNFTDYKMHNLFMNITLLLHVLHAFSTAATERVHSTQTAQLDSQVCRNVLNCVKWNVVNGMHLSSCHHWQETYMHSLTL